MLLLLVPLYAALHLVDACLLEGAHAPAGAEVAVDAGDAHGHEPGDGHGCDASHHGAAHVVCVVADEQRTQTVLALLGLLFLGAVAAGGGRRSAAAIGRFRRFWPAPDGGPGGQARLISLCVSLT